ncbi:unnamed protein product [Protopolystoma xenopodis]|uniref:Cadherin domain-containing protein n=1 Tax=Protopolystoma xenopodis TaxID=117903 RepID=A0A448WP32_9PLAT|nr:unnamed protein product [Protopolystoma xenopodis]
MLCLSVSQLIRRGQTWYLLATLALLMGQLAKAQLEADYEFQIFEELPPGHTVGNLIEAMYAPLAHSPGQQRQGSMPHEGSGVSGIENDGNSGLRFQILNAAEQGASLFTPLT